MPQRVLNNDVELKVENVTQLWEKNGCKTTFFLPATNQIEWKKKEDFLGINLPALIKVTSSKLKAPHNSHMFRFFITLVSKIELV